MDKDPANLDLYLEATASQGQNSRFYSCSWSLLDIPLLLLYNIALAETEPYMKARKQTEVRKRQNVLDNGSKVLWTALTLASPKFSPFFFGSH